MKNYGDLGGCYPPRPTTSTHNTPLNLHNSSYDTQPHSCIVKYMPTLPVYPRQESPICKYDTDLLNSCMGPKIFQIK